MHVAFNCSLLIGLVKSRLLAFIAGYENNCVKLISYRWVFNGGLSRNWVMVLIAFRSCFGYDFCSIIKDNWRGFRFLRKLQQFRVEWTFLFVDLVTRVRTCLSYAVRPCFVRFYKKERFEYFYKFFQPPRPPARPLKL